MIVIRREIAKLVKNRNFASLSTPSHATNGKDPLDPDAEERLKLDDFAGEPFYLHPHWYRFPRSSDDSRGIRPDYPDLSLEKHSYQHRDPYVCYDDQQFRRNFNEVLPEEYDILAMNSFDVEKTFSMRYLFHHPFFLCLFLLCLLLLFLFSYFFNVV